METVITDALLKEYFSGQKHHYFFEESKKLADKIKVHASGEYPGNLIEERRPSESDFIKDYRKKIWVPITEETISAVESELMKIRKADDWMVKFDASKVPAVIKKGEEPQEYFERNFPHYSSITNWAFAVLLRFYLVDANAVLLVLPKEEPEDKTAYRKPFPTLFTSDCVYEFKYDDFCVLKSKDQCDYKDDGQTTKKGDIFYVITTKSFARYEQINDKGDFEITKQYDHNLGYLPAFKLKGAYKKHKEDETLWRSRIAVMIPRLDEAVREYSDLQAEVVQHIHSEKWVIETQNCPTCNGIGTVNKNRQGQPIAPEKCPQCKGSGTVATSPYSNMVVKMPKLSDQKVLPIPPAGYIQKQIEIVRIQDERIDKHIYKSLCSVNMQYLDKVPLNESGIAKEVDKDSLNNFVNSVAEDIVSIMDQFVAIGIDYRYKDIVADELKRKEMRPQIAVPTKLDILSASYLVDEVDKLKKANINPIIVNATEIELANKKFPNNPLQRDLLNCIYELDPLSGYTQDDKMAMLQNKGVTREDYVISCNIRRLVQIAVMKDSKFFSLDYDTKWKALQALVKPIIAATEPEIDTSNPNESIDPATGKPKVAA